MKKTVDIDKVAITARKMRQLSYQSAKAKQSKAKQSLDERFTQAECLDQLLIF